MRLDTYQQMQLEMANGESIVINNEMMINAALDTLDIDQNPFAILSTSEDFYIQTAFSDNGFIIEKKEGNMDNYFRAVPIAEKPSSLESFTLDDVKNTFSCYWSGHNNQQRLIWLSYNPSSVLAGKYSYPKSISGRIDAFLDKIALKVWPLVVVVFLLFIVYVLGLIIYREFIT